MNEQYLRYAGFWSRLLAFGVDLLISLPLMGLVFWGESQSRLFPIYYMGPSILLGLFYYVWLVRRYGGTPGKLVARLRILRADGRPVTYLEAFARFVPELTFTVLLSSALIVAVLQMSDAEFFRLSFLQRSKRLTELAPDWLALAQWGQLIWIWSEVTVLLANRKKRALHDFIGNTIVVHAAPEGTPLPPDEFDRRTTDPVDY